MTQFINRPEKPNIFSGLLGGLTGALEERKKQTNLREENEALKKLGIEAEGIVDPRLREKLLETSMKQQEQQNKLNLTQLEESQTYDTIKKHFGQDAADVFKSLPTGGKTEYFKHLIDTKAREAEHKQLFGESPEEEVATFENELPEEVAQFKNNKLPKDFKYPDFNKKPFGYTPKEWNKEKETWRKENNADYESFRNQVKSTKRDEYDIKKLSQLNESKKLPDGFSRYLINPETGDFYNAAKVAGFQSLEAEEWSKIIARFGNRAKDAFGSRVTNFDLVQYLKQFPSLLNSPEGRSRILKMMQINNRLDSIYANALTQIYQKYQRNIPREKADELAQAMVKNETEQLYEQYLKLDQENSGTKKQSQSFEEMPEAAAHYGKILTDEETGQSYKSNGAEWVPING